MTVGLPFLSAIELVPSDTSNARFAATTQHVPWPKSYGGDLLAQAAAVGLRSVSDDRRLHAMHSLFVAPADVESDVEYEVVVLRDGRSYSTREVKGYQNGDVVISTLLSFHTGEQSPVVEEPMPAVTEPEQLPTAADVIAKMRENNVSQIPESAAAYWSANGRGGRSFDIRHVEPPIYGRPVSTDSRKDGMVSHVWLKASTSLPSDPAVHELALIYVCDYTILEPVLRTQGYSWTDPELTTASLDHSIWLHGGAVSMSGCCTRRPSNRTHTAAA